MQGDVVAVCDTAGNKKAEYAYDAYGNCTIVSSADSTFARYNPIRYRGYYLDRETGLYYLNARYYNPEWRRFISLDSTEYLDPSSVNGLNLYAYCNNDPVNYADPSGNMPVGTIIVLGVFIAVAALAATAHDLIMLSNLVGDSERVYVDMTKTNSSNVHIENSYKIWTPWVRYGYSIYLNYFNRNTKDIIGGTSYGVLFEWSLHNYLAWLGVGGESPKHLDVGRTIFSDSESHPILEGNGRISMTGIMSRGMLLLYLLLTPPLIYILDLIANGDFQ